MNLKSLNQEVGNELKTYKHNIHNITNKNKKNKAILEITFSQMCSQRNNFWLF